MREFINANETIREDDIETVRAAIAEACADGCRKVKIPRYNARTKETSWHFLHAIELPSQFTLILDNCDLFQGDGSYEPLICNKDANDPDFLNDASRRMFNISVLGEGNVCLSGGNHNHCLEMTNRRLGLPDMWVQHLILFRNVDGIRVENIHLEHQRWWAINHIFCANAVYRNIDFFAYPHVPNMDGIDLRIGCHDFFFENITGITGDDVLATTGLGGGERKRLVPGLSWDICHIKIRNVKAASYNCQLTRLLNHDGCHEYDYELDCLMDSSDQHSAYRPGYGVGIGSPFYYSIHVAEPGDTHDIVIKNLYSRGDVALRPAHVCDNLTASNIHTFSRNVHLFDTFEDGLTMRNVKLDHLYYGSEMPHYPDGEKVEPEKYTGDLITLPNTKGDVTVDYLEADSVRKGITVSGGVRLNITRYKAPDVYIPLTKDEASQVIIDGVEQ